MSVKSFKSSKSKVAYMQEEDDLGNIRGDVTYAASAASPSKAERMNISRKKSRRDASPSAANHFTDSDSTVHPSRRESRSSRSSRRERDQSIPPEKSSGPLTRPMSRHSKSTPVIETSSQRRRASRDNEALYYGATPASITASASRPRSQTTGRPNSYHPSSRPPLSNTRYHTMHPTHPPPPPSAMPPPSAFPPQPHWQQPPPPGPGFGMMGPPPPPMQQPLGLPPGPPPFHHEPFMPPGPLGPPGPPGPPGPLHGPPRGLHERFGQNRPQTSLGHRPPPPAVEYGHPDAADPDDLSRDMRRLSIGYPPHMEDERPRHMRAMSARPMQASPFAAPPMLPPPGPMPIRGQPLQPFQPLHDEPFEPLDGSYQEPGPLMYMPRNRRESIDPSFYEPRHYEVARTTGSRRNSYYGEQSHSSGSAFEDKLRLASSYQERKAGGMATGGMRLTEEMLEASRRGGPKSRSTRSSGSRDESDWRQSATTRTTRSSNEEDLTIRVKGNAVFRYGETEMHCQDGTEINIRGAPIGRRVGSNDRPAYPEIEDRRGRFDRPALHHRAASQSGSIYAPTHHGAPYDYGYGEDPEYTASPFEPHPQRWM